MPNLYKDIPDCEHPGCDEAGIYYLIPQALGLCWEHAEERRLRERDEAVGNG